MEDRKYGWAIEADRNKHEYVIGIDFGHGETSAAYCPIGWDTPRGEMKDPIDLDFGSNKKVIPSAICITDEDKAYIGTDAFLSEVLKKSKVNVCFKQKPLDINGEKEKLMIRYMAEVYKMICAKNPALFTSGNHLVYIATPSGWDSTAKNLYGQMAQKAGIPIAGITSESRAAFVKAPHQTERGACERHQIGAGRFKARALKNAVLRGPFAKRIGMKQDADGVRRTLLQPQQAHRFGHVHGNGGKKRLDLRAAFAEASAAHDLLPRGQIFFERNAAHSVDLPVRALEHDAKAPAHKCRIHERKVKHGLNAHGLQLLSGSGTNAPDFAHGRHAHRPTPSCIGQLKPVDDAVKGRIGFCVVVAQFGKRLARRNARARRNSHPLSYAGAYALRKRGQPRGVAVFESGQIAEDLVDRVGLHFRNHARNRSLHAARNRLIKLVVGAHHRHALLLEHVFDLKKRHAALESQRFGLFGESHDAAVVVGENNHGARAQLRLKEPLAAAVKRVAVNVQKNRRHRLEVKMFLHAKYYCIRNHFACNNIRQDQFFFMLSRKSCPKRQDSSKISDI